MLFLLHKLELMTSLVFETAHVAGEYQVENLSKAFLSYFSNEALTFNLTEMYCLLWHLFRKSYTVAISGSEAPCTTSA